ncbi:sigma-70 family RNA polymerase sigma factor [Roseateles sp. DAIF2]|uniref:RNA polymerase sigma factor n=1 Tax=Roseateles sp. DAIF2 TaxID=2714952 RepID=UPI0018A2539D|nr:sigma-70 family RNA polymerase sigma factor [Roseateles sp. DAIF2]QPF75866.1 sigma-70 family RNA polymerase sigma factor [Roseateles sp. DAIF2]
MALAPQHLPLLEAAHGGDLRAMEQLLRVCRPDVRRYAQRHCLISDVDDAVQESLLLLARRLRSLRAVVAFSGWLLRVVQRECRRLGRLAFAYDPYDEEKLEQWLVTHHDNHSLRLELSQALQSLPPHYREVLLLRDFEELAIAERLALTVAATKSRLHRARELAREYLLA